MFLTGIQKDSECGIQMDSKTKWFLVESKKSLVGTGDPSISTSLTSTIVFSFEIKIKN